MKYLNGDGSGGSKLIFRGGADAGGGRSISIGGSGNDPDDNDATKK